MIEAAISLRIIAVLEIIITVDNWPFSNQSQHLVDQTPFWSAKFPVHFQWTAISNLRIRYSIFIKWLTNF